MSNRTDDGLGGSGRGAAAAAIALVTIVALALALEPRLAELGVPGFLDRFNPYRMLGALGFGLGGAAVLGVLPRHPVGRLLLAVGAVQAASLALANYGLAGVHKPDGGLPGDRWALWTSEWLWPAAYWMVPTLLLAVFPTGRPPSRRWWPLVPASALVGVLSMVGWGLLPPANNDVIGLFPPGHRSPGPTSLRWFEVLTGLGLLLGIGVIGASLAALATRFRAARGVERRQVEWVMLGGLVLAALLLAAGVAPRPADSLLLGAAMLPLPVAMAVAVIRHGLWDIDVVLSRSLAVAGLTGVALAVHVVVVGSLGQALGDRTGAPLVATVLAAVGVLGLQARLRRVANRLVFGSRDDPDATLRRVGDILRRASSSTALLPAVVEELGRGLRVASVAIVQEGELVAAWGEEAETHREIPLRIRGEHVGTLVVGTWRDHRLRASDLRALEALAPHLSVAAHAHGLARALARAHERLLAVRADESRRLGAELHDGLGPTLAALALRVDRARLAAEREPDAGPALLRDLSGEIRDAVAVVRAIVDGLRPPVLDELGLAAAIGELASRYRGALEVRVDAPAGLPVPAPDVELALYRIAGEAIANAARHAQASTLAVRLLSDGDAVVLVVEDDGAGVPVHARDGVGLPSMRQRAAELGGSLTIVSRPGRGTAVTARLPGHPATVPA